MRQCKPRGFYTVGKGSGRVVHPVCGRDGSSAHIRARTRKAERYAQRHNLKMGHAIMVPKLEAFRTYTIPARTPTPTARKASKIERKARAREQAKRVKVKGETGLNLRATSTIARRYPSKVMLILEQAQAAYHYSHPESYTTAEPYELLEGGYIDEALESLGLRR